MRKEEEILCAGKKGASAVCSYEQECICVHVYECPSVSLVSFQHCYSTVKCVATRSAVQALPRVSSNSVSQLISASPPLPNPYPRTPTSCPCPPTPPPTPRVPSYLHSRFATTWEGWVGGSPHPSLQQYPFRFITTLLR